jgi:hypothetical protein
MGTFFQYAFSIIDLGILSYKYLKISPEKNLKKIGLKRRPYRKKVIAKKRMIKRTNTKNIPYDRNIGLLR